MVSRALGDPEPIMFYNSTDELIPAFAVMQVNAMTVKQGRLIYSVEKPDGVTSSQREFLINGPISVEPKDFGTGSDALYPVLAKMGSGESSPSMNDEFGPEADNWYLSSTKTGFVSQCSGANIQNNNISNDPLAVIVKRVSGSGGGCTGQNEIQGIVICGNPNGGTWGFNFGSKSVSGLAYNATASEIQTAMEALSDFEDGDVIVTGGPVNEAGITIEWTGNYANTAPGLITGGWSDLTGVGIGVIVTRLQQGRAA